MLLKIQPTRMKEISSIFESIAAALSDLILPKLYERWWRFQFILGVL